MARKSVPFLRSPSSDRVTRSRASGIRSLFTPNLLRGTASAVLVVSTVIAVFVQRPSGDPYHPAGFFRRVEVNGQERLSSIKSDLRGICWVPGAHELWVAGSGGLLARSDDEGRNWKKVELPFRGDVGRVEGQVIDEDGDEIGIGGARITVRREGSVQGQIEQVVVSDAGGFFQVSGNTPGNYSFVAVKPGYSDSSSLSVGLQPGIWRNGVVKVGLRRGGAPGGGSNATQEGGATEGTVSVSGYPLEDLLAVDFTDAMHGWVLGKSGSAFSTTDGGMNWSLESALSVPKLYPGEMTAVAYRQVIASGHRPKLAVTERGDALDLSVAGFTSVPTPTLGFKPRGMCEEGRKSIWLVGNGGRVERVANGGVEVATRGMGATGTGVALTGAFFLTDGRGWVTGENGTILSTGNDGRSWQQLVSGTSSNLEAVVFQGDGRTGWVAGSSGTLLMTKDGGRNWVHLTRGAEEPRSSGLRTQYVVSLPLWYYAALSLFVALLSYSFVRPSQTRRPATRQDFGEPGNESGQPDELEGSVADMFSPDRPLRHGDYDALDLRSIALGLSRFLRNENTLPPFTIAVTGEWGTGKSSLMNLLADDLRRYRFRTVRFNAWHNQKEEHLLASLVQYIRRQAVPHWWQPTWLPFRVRLLAARKRYLVLACSMAVLLPLAAGYAYTTNRNVAELVTLLREFKLEGAYGSLVALVNSSRWVVVLFGLAASVLALLKGAKSFGVDPTKMAAGIWRRLGVMNVSVETSFRYRFAKEFREVTEALGSRLAIFIDDLDRCRPENCLEVLESVNFLVTSGDCFIVMGMARERVERFIGLEFKEFAAEMQETETKETLFAEKAGAEHAKGEVEVAEADREARRTFARQYLDKIINLEVPVPAMNADQAGDALTHQAPATNRAPRMRSAFARHYGEIGLVLGAICVVFMTWVGAHLATSSAASAPSSGQAGGVVAQSTQPDVRSSGPPGRPGQSEVETPTAPQPPPNPPSAEEPATVLPPSSARWSLVTWLALIAGLTAACSVVWLLVRPEDNVVRDSKAFLKAMEIWRDAISLTVPTPRAIRRFTNRLRYLAMRERSVEEGSSVLRRLVLRMNRRPDAGLRMAGRFEVVKEPPIPEPLLVALAATEGCDRNWVLGVGPEGRKFPGLTRERCDIFETAMRNHQTSFGPITHRQYERFSKISIGVK